ncbi:MAG: VCBS repeat-containing protein, partial [Bacteroidota bacterium]
MIKKLALLSTSMIAACSSFFGQIASFLELTGSDNIFSGISPHDVHIADLDDDGFDEVIFHSNDLNSILYFENDGAGNLTQLDPSNHPLTGVQTVALGTGSWDDRRMEFADFDNDGDTDVAIFSLKYNYPNNGGLLLFENDGNQNYTQIADDALLPATLGNGQFTDVDQDGDMDCVKTTYGVDGDGKYCCAYTQFAEFDDINGTFGAFVDLSDLIGEEGESINFIDIDQDGDEDAFTGFFNNINWQEKTAANSFDPIETTPVALMSTAFNIFNLDVGDIDNDGDLDMIFFDANLFDMRYFEQGCNDPPGTTCDDGDDCTINDVLDADCNCAGTFQDSDMDGICDAEDDTNGDCTLGAACDDGDDCTINDALDADCNCVGEFQDTDMDGICDADDDTNGDCTLGASCDDGDDCTINDVFDADCNCAGEFQDSDMDGICDAEDDTNGDCTLGGACDDGDDCTVNDVFDADCNCAGEFQDSDMDGICDADDDTNGDCTLGASCDDGDDCTINDAFDADCNCVGEFQDSDMDGICDADDDTNGDCTLGGACDDGDDCTINDVFDADCNCAGEFQDSDMDGICDADDDTNGDCTLGASCDDGDDCTIND